MEEREKEIETEKEIDTKKEIETDIETEKVKKAKEAKKKDRNDNPRTLKEEALVDGLRLDEILKDSDVRESTDGEIVVTSPESVQKKTRRKSRGRRN